jgi:plasmid maintenance system killer protein
MRAALRKLAQLDAAARLEDLRVPPANRLEALAGKLRGLHSIRVNDQWRIVFRWRDDGAHEVAFTRLPLEADNDDQARSQPHGGAGAPG